MRIDQTVTQRENDSMGEGEFIRSKSKRGGIITCTNTVFIPRHGFNEGGLLGQPHNIGRHPDIPRVAYAWCWAC